MTMIMNLACSIDNLRRHRAVIERAAALWRRLDSCSRSGSDPATDFSIRQGILANAETAAYGLSLAIDTLRGEARQADEEAARLKREAERLREVAEAINGGNFA